MHLPHHHHDHNHQIREAAQSHTLLHKKWKQQPNGTIYAQASDFVHPKEVDKHNISTPVAARPMGCFDVTASDWACTGGSPSPKELHNLEKHAKETAHALHARPKKMLQEAFGRQQ